MIGDNTIVSEWRKATGWSVEKVKGELKGLNCNYWEALKLYMCAARMPTVQEQELLRGFGFNAWKALFDRRMV